MISDIMGKINHHAVYNGDVEVYPSDCTLEYVPDPDNTPIKYIDNDEMDQLLEFFYSYDDDDILDFDIQMIQA